jgi:hypothetical protein
MPSIEPTNRRLPLHYGPRVSLPAPWFQILQQLFTMRLAAGWSGIGVEGDDRPIGFDKHHVEG